MAREIGERKGDNAKRRRRKRERIFKKQSRGAILP
jgi:hypothetical protein